MRAGAIIISWCLLIVATASVVSSTLPLCSDPDLSNSCLACLRWPRCAWCAAGNHTGPRCASRKEMLCPGPDLYTHQHRKDTEYVMLKHRRYTHLPTFSMIQGTEVEIPFEVLVPNNTTELFLRVSNRPGLRASIQSPDCVHHGMRHHMRKRNRVKCLNLEPRTTLRLVIKVVLKSCQGPEIIEDLRLFNQVRKRSFLKITVQKRCSCGCESEVADRSLCSFRGTRECGQCRCDDGYYGNRCECGESDTSETCLDPGSSSSVFCNGNGECVCGQCECYPSPTGGRYSGRFCECDHTSCPASGGLLCGGHGKCSCGTCFCDANYTGDACDCFSPGTTPATCLSANGEVCNSHGVCACGQCQCEPPYRGRACEDCPTCPSQCDRYKDCVKCLSFNDTAIRSTAECSNVCPEATRYSITTDAFSGEPEVTQCQYADERDGCETRFYHTYRDGREHVIANTARDCGITAESMDGPGRSVTGVDLSSGEQLTIQPLKVSPTTSGPGDSTTSKETPTTATERQTTQKPSTTTTTEPPTTTTTTEPPTTTTTTEQPTKTTTTQPTKTTKKGWLFR